MRGFLKPSVKNVPSDSQKTFGALPRGKRMKLAETAHTTLVKADQWARGDGVPREVADALDEAILSVIAKKKAKKS
jgi:hypothetical protein